MIFPVSEEVTWEGEGENDTETDFRLPVSDSAIRLKIIPDESAKLMTHSNV